MSSKRNFEKLKHVSKRKLSIADESEYRENDRAARWLKMIEQDKKTRKRKRTK